MSKSKEPGNPEPFPAVLIVDDDRSTRMLLKKILKHSGFQVVELAANGTDAIALLGKRAYGAILLDLVMPQPDGLEVLRYLESTAPALLKKVIVITGYAQQAVNMPVYATLSKPLDVSAVLAVTRACVQDP